MSPTSYHSTKSSSSTPLKELKPTNHVTASASPSTIIRKAPSLNIMEFQKLNLRQISKHVAKAHIYPHLVGPSRNHSRGSKSSSNTKAKTNSSRHVDVKETNNGSTIDSSRLNISDSTSTTANETMLSETSYISASNIDTFTQPALITNSTIITPSIEIQREESEDLIIVKHENPNDNNGLRTSSSLELSSGITNTNPSVKVPESMSTMARMRLERSRSCISPPMSNTQRNHVERSLSSISSPTPNVQRNQSPQQSKVHTSNNYNPTNPSTSTTKHTNQSPLSRSSSPSSSQSPKRKQDIQTSETNKETYQHAKSTIPDSTYYFKEQLMRMTGLTSSSPSSTTHSKQQPQQQRHRSNHDLISTNDFMDMLDLSSSLSFMTKKVMATGNDIMEVFANECGALEDTYSLSDDDDDSENSYSTYSQVSNRSEDLEDDNDSNNNHRQDMRPTTTTRTTNNHTRGRKRSSSSNVVYTNSDPQKVKQLIKNQDEKEHSIKKYEKEQSIKKVVENALNNYDMQMNNNSSTGSKSKNNEKKGDSMHFTKTFLKNMTSLGIDMVWHPMQLSSSSSSSTSVRAFIEIEEIDNGNETNYMMNPLFVWKHKSPSSRGETTSPIGDDDSMIESSFSLFDIASVTRVENSLVNIDHTVNPHIAKDKCAIITLHQNYMSSHTTNTSSRLLFQMKDASTCKAFVHGLRWIVARLSYNLIVGNHETILELLQLGGSGGVSSDEYDGVQSKDEGRIINGLTDQLVEKSLEMLKREVCEV